tara:strand:- start:719 stop:910 length:192 start_codon:yes stop_codon:yes gene_type:complete
MILAKGKLYESTEDYTDFIGDFIKGQADCKAGKELASKTEAYIRGYSAQDSLDQINAILRDIK